jgi:hypothetical protein
VKFDNQRRADEQERARLDERQRTLRAQLALKEQQLTLTREVLARQTRSFDEGLISWLEVSKPQLDVDRLGVAVEAARAEIAEAASLEARLRFEMVSRKATFSGPQRRGNALTVSGECSGHHVTRLLVRNAGTVVASRHLAEMVCDNDTAGRVLVPQREWRQTAARR